MRERAKAILRELVGRSDVRLREGQWRTIEALIIARRRALVVQRAGWGKSAVCFVATVLLREGQGGWSPGVPPPSPGARSGTGAGVVISPLLALIRGRVAAAERAGIRAMTMNSANIIQWEEIQAQVAGDEVDALLVSPECLSNPVFRDEVLLHLAAGAALVVINETHCISDWGHGFRPDYRRVTTLLAGLSPRTPVLATTAAANHRVNADIAEQLRASSDAAGVNGEQVLVLQGTLGHDSLHLGARVLPDAALHLAWLTAYVRYVHDSSIIYCLTTSAAQEIVEHLRTAGAGVAVYAGQAEAAERECLEEDLKTNQVRTLVAISALGVGFDKPDPTFVVHLGIPSSLVSYYQQVGRAGRGVEQAEVVLLPDQEDRTIWEWSGSQGFPPEEQVRVVLDALEGHRAAGSGAMSTAVLETVTSLRRSRLESILKILDVNGAVRRVHDGWESTDRPWRYDAQRYAQVKAACRVKQEAMVAYERLGTDTGPGRTTVLYRMAFLRSVLDDPLLGQGWRCGACDPCGGLDLPNAPDQE